MFQKLILNQILYTSKRKSQHVMKAGEFSHVRQHTNQQTGDV